MKLRHAVILAMWANLLTVGATAETVIVRPDPCPPPADAPRLVPLDAAGRDVTAADLNEARAIAANVRILYLEPAPGWASRRLFARFILEPDTGLPAGGRIAGLCGR